VPLVLRLQGSPQGQQGRHRAQVGPTRYRSGPQGGASLQQLRTNYLGRHRYGTKAFGITYRACTRPTAVRDIAYPITCAHTLSPRSAGVGKFSDNADNATPTGDVHGRVLLRENRGMT
jgi:hypothetical protein